MKRILMRANMSPLDNYNAGYVIENDTIGTNAGNLIFQYSIYKTLLADEDTVIDTIRTGIPLNKEEIEKINAQYDCFVIPLANAFRKSFMTELKKLTYLIDNLKIPCIVAGVGIQAPADAKPDARYVFDNVARKFVKSVLKKSALLGLRGEMTGNYLSRLGFREGRDFTVIGCISMYMHGRKLPELKRTTLNRDSVVSFNRKPDLPAKFHTFIEKCTAEFPNHYFIPQNLFDFRLLYSGVPASLTYRYRIPPNFPQTASHELFLNDRVRGFINVPSWLSFMKNVDFSFGSRIHGNILPILAGTPSYIFVPDARIQELARYHNIPHMLIKDITDDTNLIDIYEKTDFSAVHKGHAERFDHYVDFLNANGLTHIYDGKRNYEILPMDKRIAAIDFNGPIKPIYSCPPEEQAMRIEAGYNFVKKQLELAKNPWQDIIKKAKKFLR